jgi:hypothetical protein
MDFPFKMESSPSSQKVSPQPTFFTKLLNISEDQFKKSVNNLKNTEKV